MAPRKTPGVYIEEKPAFPGSVVQVATSVPAFIGYTQHATDGHTDLTNIPRRITSMMEFETLFGSGPAPQIARDETGHFTAAPRYLLHRAMQFFFNNGGGTCWITSVGDYKGGKIETAPLLKGLKAVEKTKEITKIVIPDAVMLKDSADWARVSNAALAQCAALKDRIAILDLFRGDAPLNRPDFDPVSTFRNAIDSDDMSFGCAYYPWLNTNGLDAEPVDFTAFDASTLTALRDAITAERDTLKDGRNRAKLTELLKTLAKPVKEGMIHATHQDLLQTSATYRTWIDAAQTAWDVMPPSAGIAGVMARTDATTGVWKAPANTSLTNVTSPCVEVNTAQQEDLNVPLDGKAINAIRSFQGRGVLIWGARTLDGNAQDWRYISVRRTLIMLEQSIRLAAAAYVFSPNDESTWVTVKIMIENFLTDQWKAGALAGAKPDEAFSVAVGLGSTMTAADVLDGRLIIQVRVAVVRPAEFMVLRIEQQMQMS
ncbi:MAG: phage tail sheath C-terminal domain-containing protein [Pseudomonadota bacterium]